MKIDLDNLVRQAIFDSWSAGDRAVIELDAAGSNALYCKSMDNWINQLELAQLLALISDCLKSST